MTADEASDLSLKAAYETRRRHALGCVVTAGQYWRMGSPPLRDVEALQEELLWSLRNEDDLGLWCVAWLLDCSPEQPQAVIDAKVSLARRATMDLLVRGVVEIWEMDGWPPESYRPVPLAEFRALEDEDDLWVRPDRADRLFELRVVENGTVGSDS